MLIAGIPLYANFDAARNYFDARGIILYDSFEDLIVKLETTSPISPKTFNRDLRAENKFIECIAKNDSHYYNN